MREEIERERQLERAIHEKFNLGRYEPKRDQRVVRKIRYESTPETFKSPEKKAATEIKNDPSTGKYLTTDAKY